MYEGGTQSLVMGCILLVYNWESLNSRSEEGGCGFVLKKFQQAELYLSGVVLFIALKIDSSLLSSLVPSLK